MPRVNGLDFVKTVLFTKSPSFILTEVLMKCYRIIKKHTS